MNTYARRRRVAAALALGTGLVLAVAAPAAAHITVSSPDAEPGGYGKLVFRVPSESDTASTESITVQLPTETPFRSVSAKPVPGWKVRTTTTQLDEPVETGGFTLTEAVTEVTWTAKGENGLAPHQFGEFELSVGTFPEGVDSLTLPAFQTYSDGEVARWDQVADGGEEPEHPAPVLEISTAESTPVSATAAAEPADTVARTLGGAGLALGAAALLLVMATRRRSGRP